MSVEALRMDENHQEKHVEGGPGGAQRKLNIKGEKKYFGRLESAREMLDSKEVSWNERLLFGAERDPRDPKVQSLHWTGSRGLERLHYSRQTAVFWAVLRPNFEVGKVSLPPLFPRLPSPSSLFIVTRKVVATVKLFLKTWHGVTAGTSDPDFLDSKHGSSA